MRPTFSSSKLWKDLDELHQQYNIRPQSEQEKLKDDKERERCESSFYEFIKAAWHVVEGPQRPYIDNWHIRAIAEHLEAAYERQILDLLINIPPRCGKSTIVGVMFPAWCWAKNPNLRFLFSAHAQTLALRDSVNCRALIMSSWYQNLWGHKVKLRRDANSKRRFYNTSGGFRMITSVSGSTIGEGGDFVICDDPNSRESVESPLLRERTNLWWDGTMSTRVANPKTTVKIVIQQRLHERDLSGHILGKEDSENWTHLCLPMEFEIDRSTVTIPLKSTNNEVWEDPRTEEGELLWPTLWGEAEVEKKKKELNSAYYIAGQLQQRPAPAGGNIIKEEWFNVWCQPQLPKCDYIIQSWDTALSASDTACYSACTTWGVFEFGIPGNINAKIPQVILLSAWRGRVEYPELRRRAKRLSFDIYDIYDDAPSGEEFRPDMILVEAKANGLSLVQDLRRAGIIVTAFNPNRAGTNFTNSNNRYNNKVSRARLASSIIEAGRVWLPGRPPHYNNLYTYADEFLQSCNSFPMQESNDYVDSMSQAFIKIMQSGWVYTANDEAPEEDYTSWKNMQPLY